MVSQKTMRKLTKIDDPAVTTFIHGNHHLVSGACLLGVPLNSLLKLEADMGRMRNTVAAETQTMVASWFPMDNQRVFTSVLTTIPEMVVNNFCHTHVPNKDGI